VACGGLQSVKNQKHGEPDKAKLAKEVQDVLRCALQIAQYYGIEPELEASIEKSYQRVKAEELIGKHSHPARMNAIG
jgi:NTP pyrophosphatase (non-canonical NTP hydrolase)